MFKSYDLNEITPEFKKYIGLCKRAENAWAHEFGKGDTFFHEFFGIDRVSKSTHLGTICPANPSYKIFEIPVDECVWLPTLDQARAELKRLPVGDDKERVRAVVKWGRKIDFR